MRVDLTVAQVEALLYAAQYADGHDDEGIRSSDREAVARSRALGNAMAKLDAVLDRKKR